MRSNIRSSPAFDVDLGLFEDLLVASGTATMAPRPRTRPAHSTLAPEPSPEPDADRPKPPSAILLRPEIITLAAAVEFLSLDRGLYTVTVVGYSNELANLPPQPLPAVDIMLAPNEAADAATVMSPFVTIPPWPYDRDLVLITNVLADSAKFWVITYRRDELTTSPMLRVERINVKTGRLKNESAILTNLVEKTTTRRSGRSTTNIPRP
jgi:hypothetical protein